MLAIVERIHAAGSDAGQWQAAVEAIHAAAPGAAFSSHLSIAGALHAGHASGLAPEHFESYVAHYQFINPHTDLFRRLPPRRVFTASEVVDRNALKRTPFYHEWLKPAGDLTHGASVVLANDAETIMRVTFDFSETRAHLEPVCANLLERLMPHLLRAVEINKHVRAAKLARATLVGVLDCIDGAAFVLDGRAQVIALNQAAEALARGGRVLSVSARGRVAFRQPAAESDLQRSLAAILGKAEQPAPLAFAAGSAGEACYVSVLPLRTVGEVGASPFGVGRALMVVVQHDQRAALRATLLQTAYRLTNAEAAIVERIVGGMTVAEAADALQVSRATARNQLAAAMAKVGVRRQAELVTAVATWTLRLR